MRRIAIGLATGLAVWFGSAVFAEAQSPTITPTGPLSVVAGSQNSTFRADVFMPNPCAYRLRLWIKRGITEIHYSETIIPNPGTSYSTCTKIATHNQAVNPGDSLDYIAKIKVGTVWYDATNVWKVTVSGTRPSTKSTIHRSTSLALQAIERDRRRE